MSWTFRVSLRNVCLSALENDNVVSTAAAPTKPPVVSSNDRDPSKFCKADSEACAVFWRRFVDARRVDLCDGGRSFGDWEALLCFYFDGMEKEIPLHVVRATQPQSGGSLPTASPDVCSGKEKLADNVETLVAVPAKDAVFTYTIGAQSEADLATSLAQRSAGLHLLLRRSGSARRADPAPPPSLLFETPSRTHSRVVGVDVGHDGVVDNKWNWGSDEVLVLASATVSLLDLAVAQSEDFFFFVYRAAKEMDGGRVASALPGWRTDKLNASPRGRVSLSLNMEEEREIEMQLQFLCVRGVRMGLYEYRVRYGWQHNPMLALSTRGKRLQASRSCQSSPSRPTIRSSSLNAQTCNNKTPGEPASDEGCVRFRPDQLPPLSLTCSRTALERQQVYVSVLAQPPVTDTRDGAENERSVLSGKLVIAATGELPLERYLVTPNHHDVVSATFTILCAPPSGEDSLPTTAPFPCKAEGVLLLKNIPGVRVDLMRLAPSDQQKGRASNARKGSKKQQLPLAGAHLKTSPLFFSDDTGMPQPQSLRLYEDLSVTTDLSRSTVSTTSPSFLLSSIASAPSLLSSVGVGVFFSTQTRASTSASSPPRLAIAGKASDGQPALCSAGADTDRQGVATAEVDSQTSRLQAVALAPGLQMSPGEGQVQRQGHGQPPRRMVSRSCPSHTAVLTSSPPTTAGESAEELETAKDSLTTPNSASALLLYPDVSRTHSLPEESSASSGGCLLFSSPAPEVPNVGVSAVTVHEEESKKSSTPVSADATRATVPTRSSLVDSSGAPSLHRRRAAKEPDGHFPHTVFSSSYSMSSADAHNMTATCSAGRSSFLGCGLSCIDKCQDTRHSPSINRDICKFSEMGLAVPSHTSPPTPSQAQGATEHLTAIATGNTTVGETEVQGADVEPESRCASCAFEGVTGLVSISSSSGRREELPNLTESSLAMDKSISVDVQRGSATCGQWRLRSTGSLTPGATAAARALSFLSDTSYSTAPATRSTASFNHSVDIGVTEFSSAPQAKSIPAADADAAAPATTVATLFPPTPPRKMSTVMPSPRPPPRLVQEVYGPPPSSPSEGSERGKQKATPHVDQSPTSLPVYREMTTRLQSGEENIRQIVNAPWMGEKNGSSFNVLGSSYAAARTADSAEATELLSRGIRKVEEKRRVVEVLRERKQALRQRMLGCREAQRSKISQLRCRAETLAAAEEDLRNMLSELLQQQRNSSANSQALLQRAAGEQKMSSPLDDAAMLTESALFSARQDNSEVWDLQRSVPNLSGSSISRDTALHISSGAAGLTPKTAQRMEPLRHPSIPLSPSLPESLPDLSSPSPRASPQRLRLTPNREHRGCLDTSSSQSPVHVDGPNRPAVHPVRVLVNSIPGDASAFPGDDHNADQRKRGPSPMTPTHPSWVPAQATRGNAARFSSPRPTPGHEGGEAFLGVHTGEAKTPGGAPPAYQRSFYARHLDCQAFSPRISLGASPVRSAEREKSASLTLIERELLRDGVGRSDRDLVMHLLYTKPHLFFTDDSLLHIACGSALPDIFIFEALLKVRPELAQGVDVITGNTALHVACAARYPNADVVQRLIVSGTPITARNSEGLTAFHLALLNPGDDSTHRVKDTLLAAGSSSVNERTADGRTPLHLVCTSDERLALVRYLVHRGADLWAHARSGGLGSSGAKEDITPLQLSRHYHADAVSSYLQGATHERHAVLQVSH